MAIRHWHPVKLGIVWLIDLALFRVLWLLTSPYSREQKAWIIIIWLISSIPVFVVTWKWATGRELEEHAKKNTIIQPVMQEEDSVINQATEEEQVIEEREYRIHTLQISRSALDAGYEIHPRHFIPKGEEIEGWKFLSVYPLEKKSDEVQITLVAFMERTLDLR